MPASAPGGPARRGNFDLVVAVFCGLLLISNVAATKLIAFGPDVTVGGFQFLPLVTDGGALLFPLTYVLGDVLAEVYGFRSARRAIWTGFVLAAVMAGCFALVDLAPAASDWPYGDAWHSVLGFVPRIVVASLLGYLAGQMLNALVLVRIRERTGPQRLWVRLLGSTLVGEFADTLVFCTIAFGPLGVVFGGGSISTAALVNYILVGFVWKVLVEVACLPFTYRVIGFIRKREPVEVTAPWTRSTGPETRS